jgi:replicative DNA helicase
MSETTVTEAVEAGADLKKSRRQKMPLADLVKVDRVLPHSVEAEQGVLGCVLLAPREGMGHCLEKFKAGDEVFYEPNHRYIYQAIVQMYEQQAAIDLVTLGQRLRDRNQLEGVGGYAYLSSLMSAVPSAANLAYYVDIVREKYLLRKMIETCTRSIALAYEEQEDVGKLLDEIERDVLLVGEERVDSSAQPVKVLVKTAIATIEEFWHRQGALTGLGTGFVEFDRLTSGLHKGDMVVVAARPSMGKTALAMNIAEHVALELKQPVAVFSLEMKAEALMLRMLCSLARVNLRHVREGFLSEEDLAKLRTAAGRIASAPLFIDDSADLSILQLRGRARRLHLQYQVKLFIVDYLQLLHSTARRAENRQQEIAEISRGVKALAKELGAPVLVLSQLNRELEKREKGAKPRLSDLRESGAIEQDADVVGLLYDPTGGDDDSKQKAEESDTRAISLLIAKQRNGPTGDVPLMFLRGYTRFENVTSVSAEDVAARS